MAAAVAGPLAAGSEEAAPTSAVPGTLGLPGSRSAERALEEAVATGTLNLSNRRLKNFPRGAARSYDLSDITQAGECAGPTLISITTPTAPSPARPCHLPLGVPISLICISPWLPPPPGGLSKWGGMPRPLKRLAPPARPGESSPSILRAPWFAYIRTCCEAPPLTWAAYLHKLQPSFLNLVPLPNSSPQNMGSWFSLSPLDPGLFLPEDRNPSRPPSSGTRPSQPAGLLCSLCAP